MILFTGNYSYSGCKHKKAYEPIAGIQIEYDECAVTGTFSVTLANYFNETIVITNGSFTFYQVRKRKQKVSCSKQNLT